MSDQPSAEPAATPEPAATSEPVTGHPAVDEVLAGLQDLGSRPVAEHVAVFEAAHEQLRGALAGAADAPAPSTPA